MPSRRWPLVSLSRSRERTRGGSTSGRTRADALLLGAVLAVAVSTRPEPRGRAKWAAIALVPVVLVGLSPNAMVVYLWLPTIVAVLGAAAVLWLAQGTAPCWATSRPLVRLGHRSYGIYLWNGPAYYLVDAFGVDRVLAALLICAMNFAAAWVSWRYVETPFLRLKNHPSSGGVPLPRLVNSGNHDLLAERR